MSYKFIKQLFCNHHYVVKRNCNIFEKTEFYWFTLFRCTKCGKEKFSHDYVPAGKLIEL